VKFKLSGFIYGMGTGIIVLALLYYTVYSFDLSERLTENKLNAGSAYKPFESYELTDPDEISGVESLAKRLGMVYPAEIPIPKPLTNDELVVKAAGLGMGFDVEPLLPPEDADGEESGGSIPGDDAEAGEGSDDDFCEIGIPEGY